MQVNSFSVISRASQFLKCYHFKKKMNFVQDFYLKIRLLRDGQQNIIMAFFITHRLCFTFYNLLCWGYYAKIKRAICWHESIYSFISMIYFYIYWYQPSSCHWSFARPPWNIRKPLACWCFQGVRRSPVTWNKLTNLRSMINSHIETSQLFVSFKSVDWFLFGGTLAFKCFEKIKKNFWTGYLCNIFVKFYKMIHRNDMILSTPFVTIKLPASMIPVKWKWHFTFSQKVVF